MWIWYKWNHFQISLIPSTNQQVFNFHILIFIKKFLDLLLLFNMCPPQTSFYVSGSPHISANSWMVDAKTTPSYSPDLRFSGLHYRPNREALICSKICQKSSKTSKKVDNVICLIKKVDNDAICPIKDPRNKRGCF